MLLLIVLLLPLMSLLLVVAAVLSTLVTVDLLHIGKDEAPNPLAWLLCILQLPLWYYTIKTIIIFSSIYLSAMSFLWKGTPSTTHNIHSIVKNEKSVQKKFAFAENGGIVSVKSVKSLTIAGGNSAPTNNHFDPDFWAVSRIFPGVSIVTISTHPPFFRALKCAKKANKKSFTIEGNKCEVFLPHPAVSGKFPEKSHSTFAIRSSRAIVSVRSAKTLYTAAVATDTAATPRQHIWLIEDCTRKDQCATVYAFLTSISLFRICSKTDAEITLSTLIHRRFELCQTHKTCKANSQSRNSVRTLNAHNELSTTPEKKIHFCRHAAQTLLSLKFSRCGSMTESKKSRGSGWTNGQKQFEWQQQPADSIAENNRIHKFLAVAGRPDRGFYRPCKMTQARSFFV